MKRIRISLTILLGIMLMISGCYPGGPEYLSDYDLIATEYSEWNHIFLYVVNTLKKRKREFGYVASRIQGHISGIEQFLKQLPRGGEYADRIRSISGMLEKKILFVDDHGPIIELMTAVLESEGTVTTARNGQEAYELVSKEYYDAIVTDIEMPVMDGIEFYKKTVEFFFS